ncbi:putative peroxisomal-coenzyme A synthetase [Zalerion maritima]|uniref:Peroxisomal-coenzyme A synthetase n=1 Tax=Zalerion maritima TaxID=339359 RepID=A0AAD5RFD9_9PEZI|nr:putative peroxisomal-coenzyme A synthetase [Zalerion maritima]
MSTEMHSYSISRELEGLYSFTENDLPFSSIFKSLLTRLQSRDLSWEYVLDAIPVPGKPSFKPLNLFRHLVSSRSEKTDSTAWRLAVIRNHNRLFLSLPESARTGHAIGYKSPILEHAEDVMDDSCGSLGHFFRSSSNDPALYFGDGTSPIRHAQLSEFIDTLPSRLPIRHALGTKKPVVAVVLPNGPLVAAAVMAMSTYFVAAPVNPGAGHAQVLADVVQAGSSHLFTTEGEFQRLGFSHEELGRNNIQAVLVELDARLNMSVVWPVRGRNERADVPVGPNTAADTGLVLFTSGTSGTKKVVPITIRAIVQGVAQVIESWGLGVDDVCCNMMPLFHVGGLIRNVFAPVISGGSVLCCPAFDAGLFWDFASKGLATWYYASPSMHALILDEGTRRPEDVGSSRVRLVCNAAGALLPSLATQLRDTFNCTVLPSYGMTECMPISTPPLSYALTRPGTSGVTTGPEIAILSPSSSPLPPRAVGHIGVRGAPVFSGYLLPNGELDRSGFTSSGFFDTGDVGYLDDDGYLYITGRSKEVINRGGEVISPFEIEDAVVSSSKVPCSPISGRVSAAAAFSIPHDVLQEVVGVAVVTPPGKPRIDIRSLQDAVSDTLQKAKWPVILVFVDDIPRKGPKVVRIGLSSKLGLPEMTDHTKYSDRHWEAPGEGEDLQPCRHANKCDMDPRSLNDLLELSLPRGADFHSMFHPEDGTLEVVLAPRVGTSSPEMVASLQEVKTGVIRNMLREVVDNYILPHHFHVLDNPLPRSDGGAVDEEYVRELLEQQLQSELEALERTVAGRIQKIFADILNIEPHETDTDATFFQLGGDSLLAGRLLSALRSQFSVSIPLALLFSSGSVNNLTDYIETRVSESGSESGKSERDSLPGCSVEHNSRSPWLMAIQLVPLLVFYPLRRAFQWTLFMLLLSFCQQLPTMSSNPGRLLNLAVSIAIARAVTRVVFPILGIIAKWAIVGRHRAGLYPMWGLYHTRWWLTQKIVDVCGLGIFGWTNSGRVLYHRLMGARVGRNVTIEMAKTGEWDLLEIGDDVVLEKCTVRPFAAERNTSMLLSPIIIGRNSSVGVASIIAPGSTIPPSTHIGPNSSSWEMKDAKEDNAGLLQSLRAKPAWYLRALFTFPLFVVTGFVGRIPWLLGLLGLVLQFPSLQADPLSGILEWFTQNERVAFHYLAMALQAWLAPFFLFGFVVLIKYVLDLSFGRLEHLRIGVLGRLHDAENGGRPVGVGTVERWRMDLMNTVMPTSRLHDMTGMMGSHYEGTSKALRLLGATVGERVYWPGTGPSIGDYHLIEVGSDVVFGSRSHLATSDSTGSERVVIGNGSMIADRVALLPGVHVGECTTMGSGALTKRGTAYGRGGTYVGSKGGDAICLNQGGRGTKPSEFERAMRSEKTLVNPSTTDISEYAGTSPASTVPPTPMKPVAKQSIESVATIEVEGDGISPFGRAFYLRQAPYYVLPFWMITAYSTFTTVSVSIFWNVPSISSIQIAAKILLAWGDSRNDNLDAAWLFAVFFAATAILTFLFAILALAIVISAKWLLMGRRKEGNYDWDKSSYCQRWQAFLTIERLRGHCFRGHGVLGMLTGTEWIVMYFRLLGAKVGENVCLFANGNPSLMFTEPELVDIGDRVAVDDASVVAHINTRGKFDLNRLSIGDRAVLRTGSRLLSGATMGKDSCLLEHTLVMGGDVVEDGWTMQGWPADKFEGLRLGSNHGSGS